ncbi:MAG: hypothetical protein HUK21_03560 [Fibrobacteraceae bacterium]|nr:hypothetical protein [Fibrobacteraceae bacterium]
MKYPYNFIVSAIALFSVLSFAQPIQPLAIQDSTPAAPSVTEIQSDSTQNIPPVQPVATTDSSSATQPVVAAETEQQPQPDSVQSAQATATPVAQTIQKNPPQSDSTPNTKNAGSTEIKGEIHGFLRIDNSPYLVTADLIIAPNTSLVVAPGVTLYFAPGTGINVNNGKLILAGSSSNSVVLQSAIENSEAGSWKGIFITGENQSEIRKAEIKDAQDGIAVENGKLNIQGTTIKNTSARGVYIRNGSVSLSNCKFENNKGVALHADNYANVEVEQGRFIKNQVALLNSELASTNVISSRFNENEYGVMNMGNSILNFTNTKVEKNNVGLSSIEVVAPSVLESISNNRIDFNNTAMAVAATLPPSPEIPGVESRPLAADQKVETLAQKNIDDNDTQDTLSKRWNMIGNVMLGGAYHHVMMSDNNGPKTVVGSDTIKHGHEFNNNFQTPGLMGNASTYILLQSPYGQNIEFSANLTSDSWNYFSPNPITLRYTDAYNNFVLGDFQKAGGEIYMSSLPIFGAEYTLSLFKNNAEMPLFELSGFYGEARRPLTLDSRHPYIYNEYIDDGELQAQRIAYGGSFKWAPLRRFDAKLGAIYAYDEMEDPLLRDGSNSSHLTSDPLQKSFTIYADGNWLFFPGDIELNGQIAVGRADTSDVNRERAINKVFADAGLNTSSMSKLRILMQNQSRINSLSDAELTEIFGDNTTLSRSKMRDSLRTLIREAKYVQKEYESDIDDSRVMGLNWGSQNFAIGASLNWSIYKTNISGHIKYVGEDYYSAGSPDQLSDTREFGGRLEQGITDFWSMALGYQINVENAANGGATNLFGLGESTRWGLFAENKSKWFDKHELDPDRSKYIQNANLEAAFKIGKSIDLNLGYNIEHKKQYRPYQLHGNYIMDDGVYKDDWFSPQSKKSPQSQIIHNGDTTVVDSLHWAEYMMLSDEPYLASKFQEKLLKQTVNANISLHAFNSIFKVGGRWTVRTDGSEFYKDELIKDFDFADTTWAKLGYYFNGSNYFEQAYPISVASTFPMFQNRVAATLRFKDYERDNMDEGEITVEENFEMPLLNRFLIVGVNGEFRYMLSEWKENDKNVTEEETDILGSLNVRINHNKHFYSEWFAGTAIFLRPDNLSNEYKDIYGGVNLNYVF